MNSSPPRGENLVVGSSMEPRPVGRPDVAEAHGTGVAGIIAARAHEGADVINMSLAGPSDILLGRLIGVATSRGIRMVATFLLKLKNLPRP